MTMFHIEYRACPTSWNAPVTISTEHPQRMVLIDWDKRLKLTPMAERNGHATRDGVVIQRVYVEYEHIDVSDAGKDRLSVLHHVHYMPTAEGGVHYSQQLLDKLGGQVKQLLVD